MITQFHQGDTVKIKGEDALYKIIHLEQSWAVLQNNKDNMHSEADLIELEMA